MEYVGQAFRGTTVQIHGNTFKDCIFDDVIFTYAGGPMQFERCTFKGFKFQIAGELAFALEGLRQIHQRAGPQAVDVLVKSVSEFLRTPLPKQTFTIG